MLPIWTSKSARPCSSTRSRSTRRAKTVSMPPTPRIVYQMSPGSGTIPMGATTSAARIVLADPVSTSASAISVRFPRCTMVIVANGRSSFSVSCIGPPNANPPTLPNVQGLSICMNEVEFPKRMCPVKALVAPQRHRTIRTGLNDSDVIEHTLPALSVGLQRFDDKPLIRIGQSCLGPIHVYLFVVKTSSYFETTCRIVETPPRTRTPTL